MPKIKILLPFLQTVLKTCSLELTFYRTSRLGISFPIGNYSPTLRQERRVLSIQMLNNPAKVCAGITRRNLFGNPLFVLSDLRPENSNMRRLLFSTVVDDLMHGAWATVSYRASHSTSNPLF